MRNFKRYVLFICGNNSVRSKIAQAFLEKNGGEYFIAESAGFEPNNDIDPQLKTVIQESGLTLSSEKTESAFELFQKGRQYNFIITVCDEETAEQCPLFPGISRRIHWNIMDPYKHASSEEEKLTLLREVRDSIEEKVNGFIEHWAKFGK